MAYVIIRLHSYGPLWLWPDIFMTRYSYGPYSYGLYSCGLYSHGMYSYSYGLSDYGL